MTITMLALGGGPLPNLDRWLDGEAGEAEVIELEISDDDGDLSHQGAAAPPPPRTPHRRHRERESVLRRRLDGLDPPQGEGEVLGHQEWTPTGDPDLFLRNRWGPARDQLERDLQTAWGDFCSKLGIPRDLQ